MVPYDELYDTVRGLMASEYAVAGVENLFAEGSYCQRRYDDMRQAYARLCVRLGVEDEDRDLEQMISALDAVSGSFLLHRDAFCQIPGLIHVQSLGHA